MFTGVKIVSASPVHNYKWQNPGQNQMNRNNIKCVLTHFINAILVSGHLMRERYAAVQVSALRALR